MVNDFVGRLTGYALPNIFDLLGEMMEDGIDEDDFRAEKSETAWDNVKKTAQDIASNVPFVSGPLGAVFGAGNSRLPIQSVIPNIDNIMTAQGEEARSMALKKELSKPLYGFLAAVRRPAGEENRGGRGNYVCGRQLLELVAAV